MLTVLYGVSNDGVYKPARQRHAADICRGMISTLSAKWTLWHSKLLKNRSAVLVMFGILIAQSGTCTHAGTVPTRYSFTMHE